MRLAAPRDSRTSLRRESPRALGCRRERPRRSLVAAQPDSDGRAGVVRRRDGERATVRPDDLADDEKPETEPTRLAAPLADACVSAHTVSLARAEGDAFELRVADNGAGIDQSVPLHLRSDEALRTTFRSAVSGCTRSENRQCWRRGWLGPLARQASGPR
jgi:hypothetical protein